MHIKHYVFIAMISTLTACGGGEEITQDPGDTPNPGGSTPASELYLFEIFNTQSVRGRPVSSDNFDDEYAHSLNNVHILEPSGKVLGDIAPLLPIGAIYTGSGVVDAMGVTDGTATYSLTNGSAQVVLTDNAVDVTLNGFDFALMDGTIASPIASIAITDANVGSTDCGHAAAFCGGTFSVKRENSSPVLIGSSATKDLKGAFFGPNGAEAGGIVSIYDDQSIGINAAFIATSE